MPWVLLCLFGGYIILSAFVKVFGGGAIITVIVVLFLYALIKDMLKLS